MGNAVVTGINIATYTADKSIKYMYLDFNYPQYNKRISFYEENKVYNDESQTVIEPKFCLEKGQPIEQCGLFLSDMLSKKYVLTNGLPCRTFKFRPGSLIIYDKNITEKYLDSSLPSSASQYIGKGHRCKFVKRDFMAMDSDVIRCCTTSNKQNCPNILNNNYETENCDNIMSKFCKSNPDNINCLEWLRTNRKIALSTYADICSKHMDQRYCSEFIRVVRPDNYTFGDTALLNFCKNHRGNRNCWCVFQPNSQLDTDINGRYLGPKVCWLHECTDETRDRKWLLFDQDVQRSRCKYIGCSININSLILKNSNANLIADCSGNKVNMGDINPGTPMFKTQLNIPELPSFLIVFFILSILFYFISIYGRNKIKTNVINVHRR
ncbi:Myristylated protein, essential for entry/fusion [Eptesipox virus]|uniref:Myristylated protein, essential for entry/fusion n=1 Tax=Eptesipox virus TaxID=1329402 RepID=A0A220T6G7_9POXV|nr:Myristylated protein, essential for entry/fusion [Eptesipox virus]ASK51314.1 Myristylated protein, essential for entry/fusion [Eptesipox virus]WAH71072.1 myristylated protein, essential for entry/fusion [Eptesipox virus]